MKRKTILTLSPIWLIAAAAVILIYRSGLGESKYETITVSRMDLTQEVSVTGTVKPRQEVSLSFETSGKVARVYKDVGDEVRAGEIIVSLGNSDLLAESRQSQARLESVKASVLDAEAGLEREQARLAEVKAGSRPEEVRLAEIKVANAWQAMADAETGLANSKSRGQTDLGNLYSDVSYLIADAYSKSLTAVNQRTDAMFKDELTDYPQLTFVTSSQSLDSLVENERIKARDALHDLSALLRQSTTEQAQLDRDLNLTEQKLVVVKNFLLDLERAVNLIIGLAEDNKAVYRADVSQALSEVSSSLQSAVAKKQTLAGQKVLNVSNLSAAEASLKTAQGVYLSALSELELKKSGATKEQIGAAAAQVKQADANLISAKARVQEMEAALFSINDRLARTSLRAPFAGLVTKQNAKAGEIVSGLTPLISLISANLYEAEINIPEVDIAKAKIGDEAAITFDAYGEDIIFAGKVGSIDPAAGIVQGVATYRVIIVFEKEDARIKSGLTANVDIITARRQDALAMPERFVLTKENKKFVRLLRGQEAVEVEVKTGLSDGKGNVGILEGVEEGDKIITNY